MKRFLSWLTLIGCYIAFCLIVSLDMALLGYIAGLYYQLSAFLKLIVIIVGGSFILGIALAPLWYGIPLTYSASEAVCPSKRGDRYVVMGVLILAGCVLEIITGFMLRDILIGIYGIALIIYGRSQTN
jgi:hypothetical protein